MARHDGTHLAPLPGGAFVQSPPFAGLRDTKAKGGTQLSEMKSVGPLKGLTLA